MLNPAIGELIEKYESRYQLVLDVARKAREISAAAEENGEIIIEKPVSLAIDRMTAPPVYVELAETEEDDFMDDLDEEEESDL